MGSEGFEDSNARDIEPQAIMPEGFNFQPFSFDLPIDFDSFIIFTPCLLPVLGQLKTHLKGRPKIRRLSVFFYQNEMSEALLAEIKRQEFHDHPALNFYFLKPEVLKSMDFSDFKFGVEKLDFLRPTRFICLFHPAHHVREEEIVSHKNLENQFLTEMIEKSQEDIDFSSQSNDVLQGVIQTFQNLETLMKNPDPRILKKIGSENPAFILGAGDSLESHIEFIKDYQSKAVVIAPDTLAGRLKKFGIEVDFYSSIERGFAVQRFFENWQGQQDSATLVGTSCLVPRIYELFSNQKVISFVSDDAHAALPLRRGMLNHGHSCVGLSMSLASVLGCPEAYLMGVDLSYSADFKSHSSISPYYESQFADISLKMKEKEKNISFASAYDGSLLKTDPYWLLFRQEFEDIARKSKTKFLNLSNKGLLLKDIPFHPKDLIRSQLHYLKTKQMMKISDHLYDRDSEAREDLKNLSKKLAKISAQLGKSQKRNLELQKLALTSDPMTSKFFEAVFRNSWAIMDFKSDQSLDIAEEKLEFDQQLDELSVVCDQALGSASKLLKSTDKLY